jgi:hypothetical protein
VERIAWAFAVNVFGKARVRRWLRRRFGVSRSLNLQV